MATPENEINKTGGLMIAGGLFIGMGIGFLLGKLTAGMFIGLGAGLVVAAIYRAMSKRGS